MPKGIPKTNFDLFDHIVEKGAPLKAAIFHDTVRFGVNGTPEFAFYDPSQKSKPTRTAKMWYHADGIALIQGQNKKILPTAAMKDNDLL